MSPSLLLSFLSRAIPGACQTLLTGFGLLTRDLLSKSSHRQFNPALAEVRLTPVAADLCSTQVNRESHGRVEALIRGLIPAFQSSIVTRHSSILQPMASSRTKSQVIQSGPAGGPTGSWLPYAAAFWPDFRGGVPGSIGKRRSNQFTDCGKEST